MVVRGWRIDDHLFTVHTRLSLDMRKSVGLGKLFGQAGRITDPFQSGRLPGFVDAIVHLHLNHLYQAVWGVAGVTAGVPVADAAAGFGAPMGLGTKAMVGLTLG